MVAVEEATNMRTSAGYKDYLSSLILRKEGMEIPMVI
jgi:hypothetical protein